ncbi:MAG: hypothetical protein IKK57_10005 [Clostridia bacterium]|nr:hypothetical protein [Clostridia bacterium]
MLTWELLGAATGAGLASGREVAAFFGDSGAWGYAGLALAALTVAWLAGARLPEAWQGRWPERLWRGLNALLLTAVGGAMLAGAGEMTASLLPSPWGRLTGMGATLLLSWLLARRTASGLAWVSRMLLAGMTALLLWALMLPPMQATLPEASLPAGLLRGVTYGGFNAALLQPLLVSRPQALCRTSLRRAAVLLAMLLALGQATLLHHPAAMAYPMPFLYLASSLGEAASCLAWSCLYLAILSTLSACMKSLGGWGIPGVCGAAALGFTGVVDAAYPVLGGGCALMLAAMRAAAGRRGGNVEDVVNVGKP